MKVLYISNDSGISGSSIALQNIIESVIPKGVTPLVICRNHGHLTEWLSARGLQYEIMDYNWNFQPPTKSVRDKISYCWRILKYYMAERRSVKSVIQVADKFHPDVIHTNNGIIHFGYKAAISLGIPHVWHIREYQDLDFGMTPIPSMNTFRNMLKRSYCICITKGVQNYFRLKPDNSIVVYDGVMQRDSQRFSSLKEDYFLFVGRIEDSKGFGSLISAYYTYKQKGGRTPLRVAGVGKDEYVDKMKNEVERMDLTSNIEFLGFRTDRFDLMYKAKALIVPSKFEGFGFITVEAIFNGCVVFGHNTAGTAEIASYCKNMVKLYDNGTELVELMLNNHIPCSAGIKNDQNLANTYFSSEEAGHKVFDYYNTILCQ